MSDATLSAIERFTERFERITQIEDLPEVIRTYPGLEAVLSVSILNLVRHTTQYRVDLPIAWIDAARAPHPLTEHAAFQDQRLRDLWEIDGADPLLVGDIEHLVGISDRVLMFYRYQAIRAFALLPLVIDEQIIGFIHLTWQTVQSFQATDHRNLTLLARQVVWILQSLQLSAQLQARVERTEYLLLLTTILSYATSENEIVESVGTHLARYEVHQTILHYLDSDDHGNLTTITMSGIWESVMRVDRITRLFDPHPIPAFLQPYLIGRDPIIIPDTSATFGALPTSVTYAYGVNAPTIVILPLYTGRICQGALFLAWKAHYLPSQEARDVFAALTQIVAPVVASRRAYLVAERARLQSEARARELEMVSKVSAAASENLDLDHLLQTVVDLGKSGFNLYHAQIYLADQDGQTLHLAAAARDDSGRGDSAWTPVTLSLVEDRSLTARCGRERRGIIINDVTQNPDFQANPTFPAIRSEMAVPMILGQQLIGVISVQAREVERFTPNILLVLTALANEIAVSVQNARLYAEQLKVADELRNLDHLKSQFLANMSHELRTPLNAILNFTYFVASGVFGPVNEKQVDALSKVTESGRHLLGLINDVLDFSKIEAGMMQLFLEDFALDELLDGVLAATQSLHRSPQVELRAEIAPDLPIISADKRRLRQILLNLISNAIKFTEHGTITLVAQIADDHVRFAVHDTGKGIPPEEHEAIFEAFKQTPDGLMRGGTGLGLPISRRLAEAHGGHLWVESRVGHGASFYVTIPLSAKGRN
ncbi:MAG: ATP-binding protein [Anaerolineae bacterium]|jgi:signal transduction histidine kinase|nr:ATP-binding protein [Anaerolineae bacterium]